MRFTGGAGAFVPVRFSPDTARLRFTGGTAILGPAGMTPSDVTTPKLDRLQRQAVYFNQTGNPTTQMQIHWQRTMEAIEAAFTALTGQVTDLSTIVAQIQAANALATAANSTAVATQSAIDIANSYTDPTNVVSAANDGTIAIAAHERIYGTGGRVSVGSGSASGFAPGDYVTVFYDDAARAGGAVTYHATTLAVAQTGNRHIVGQVTIPELGDPPATGTSPAAPGYTPGRDEGVGYDIP